MPSTQKRQRSRRQSQRREKPFVPSSQKQQDFWSVVCSAYALLSTDAEPRLPNIREVKTGLDTLVKTLDRFPSGDETPFSTQALRRLKGYLHVLYRSHPDSPKKYKRKRPHHDVMSTLSQNEWRPYCCEPLPYYFILPTKVDQYHPFITDQDHTLYLILGILKTNHAIAWLRGDPFGDIDQEWRELPDLSLEGNTLSLPVQEMQETVTQTTRESLYEILDLFSNSLMGEIPFPRTMDYTRQVLRTFRGAGFYQKLVKYHGIPHFPPTTLLISP